MPRSGLCLVAVILTFGSAFVLSGCGSSNSPASSNMAAINIMVSDPATCSTPNGQFSHIFVTITDVQINSSSSAGPNDSGWIDLTPNLKQSPMQIDLLGQANNQCFLATLGSTSEIQPGTFQQIRIMLAANNATVSGNKCGSAANCVMLNSNPSTPQTLQLSSESQTGIKIPSGQIAGGGFVVAAGQTKDLDIDFNACESIVQEGNGQFRLKPVLRAGEVSLTSSSINGKVVDSATSQPISGGTTVVALEQKDSSGVDRVIMETTADSSGGFVFCPVPAGTYDVVAVAVSGSQVDYGATVITGVQPGNSLGNVPLTAQAGANKAAASITGQVTTSTGSAATAADITVSALQSITVNSSSFLVTIPLAPQSAAAVVVPTATGASCPAKTDCATYTLMVPAANPSVGSFNTSGNQNPAPPATGVVNYTVDARAFVIGSGSTADCSPSDMQTNMTATSTPLTVVAGTPVTAATLAFTGCQ
ncbi:MAG TPA: DUF4382 domain-containing protein [Candidatus Angelobacter sp.]|nr:DUF4382 domain-containing protein [Candidatus Angelobacter sp.]